MPASTTTQTPKPRRRATKQGFSGWLPERSPEKHTLEHFERFAYSLKLPDDRGPFRLEPFMLEALEDYYAGIFENLWLWPTGTAKSTLLGALALHHGTYVRSDCNVMILGGLGGHGRNTLDAATGFIDRSSDLSRWWVSQEYGMGRIKSKIDRGLIIVSSAGRRVGGRGGSSQEGKAPTLVLVEELHRHEDNGAAVRTLTSKVQKRSVGKLTVQIVHATTAGDTLESPLGRMIARSTDTDSGAVVTRPHKELYHRRAIDGDGDLVLHEYSVPDEIQPPADKTDRKAVDAYLAEVKKANPASWITLKNLRRMFKAASSEVWVFLRQNANQWVTQDVAALDKVGWYAGERGPKWVAHEHQHGRTSAKTIEIPKNAKGVYVGLDTATKWDRTAIVPVWRDPETGVPRTCRAVILSSSKPGAQRRMRDAIDVLDAMRQIWPKMALVFDRNKGGGLIAEQLEEDHGMVVIDHGQGLPMEIASMLLAELLDQRGLEHDGHPELTQHVLAAVARRTRYGQRWRLEQPRDGRPIDGAVALAMAVNMAMNPPVTETTPMFTWR